MVANTMRPWFLGIFSVLCLVSQGCGEGLGVDTYSWVAWKYYETDACDTLWMTLYFPLDTCFCGLVSDKCQIWSKSGANRLTQKIFAATDTSCQTEKHPEKTETVETVVTDTCKSSYKYEFAGDGPGAVLEMFKSKTCDPGTSTGQHAYYKLDACMGGKNSAAQVVCESGKFKQYGYTSANCTAGRKFIFDLAVGECFADSHARGGSLKSGESVFSSLLFKSGC